MHAMPPEYREAGSPLPLSAGKLAAANRGRDVTVYATAMDASEDWKAGLIFPHLIIPEGGRILDLGGGTGALAERAARFFSHSQVYVQDLSHELLEIADHRRSVIRLVYGDALQQQFPDNSLHGAYCCSTGHEIEQFGGPGSMHKVANIAYQQLLPGARFVVRDFVKPNISGDVYMRIIPKGDGIDDLGSIQDFTTLDYNTLSTRALFERFHAEFQGGGAFEYERVTVGGGEYIRLSAEFAYEFYMHKDYTTNWRNEVHEKYSYWTEEEAQAVFEAAGFEDVNVIPEHNDWIRINRLEGQIALFSLDSSGTLLPVDFPPTHMVVVGQKPGKLMAPVGAQPLLPHVNYEELLGQISINDTETVVSVNGKEFNIIPDTRIEGTKRLVFNLVGEPKQVLKIPRIDAPNAHNCFKAMGQAIDRQDILRANEVPTLIITDCDPDGPPYRYLVQDALPEGAECAADLIKNGELTERDVKQVAKIVNRFELKKQRQLDTNPFNWYRVTDSAGKSEMVYIDSKVYLYDEKWAFSRVGLLQWCVPELVQNATQHCAGIPTSMYADELSAWWHVDSEVVGWWKKHLNPHLQPLEEKD